MAELKKKSKKADEKKAPRGRKTGKRSKKGKRGKRKGLSRGARVFLTLIGLAVVVMGAYLGVDQLNKILRAAKTVNVAVDLEIGGEGTDPGKFREPWSICLDTKGDLVVADFGNHRIQVIDPTGKVLRAFGVRGNREGDFEQPCAVWVDADDNLYVADTFNHRIQKFDARGRFLAQWKRSFFGPRGISGDTKGRVFITDTGNHKVQMFDTEGRFLKEIGRFGTKEGEFQEPMGTTVDAAGNLYVCDTENRRIQKFNPKGVLVSSFKVPGWKGKCCESPYAAIILDSLYVTNASENSVLRLSLDGKLQAIYKRAGGFPFASGLAADTQGRLWVSQKSSHKIARFAPPPLSAKR